jgi:hypothetical protein
MKNAEHQFQIGEIAYLIQGIGEFNIQAVMIKKINKKTATVANCLFDNEFKVDSCSLVRDRDLFQQVFDYIMDAKRWAK